MAARYSVAYHRAERALTVVPHIVADEKGDISKEMSEALARSKIRAVMHQKPQGKFECVLDCLNHKVCTSSGSLGYVEI